MNELVICKNTLVINYNGNQRRQLFTEDGIYKASFYDRCFIAIIDNYNNIYVFYLPEKDDASNKLKELWFSDWFYTKAELRQKQIDSVIN